MTDASHTELNIWRDYERGKVGIQLEGLPQKLLSPDDARNRAAELESNAPDYFTFPEHVAQVDDIAAKLREYADDVETTNSE